MPTIDLTGITFVQLALIALACAGLDTLVGTLAAVQAGTFSLAFFPTFLSKHVLLTVAPIVGLAAFAQTLPQPASAAVFAIAIVGLTGYVGQTILSISESFHAASAPPAAAA